MCTLVPTSILRSLESLLPLPWKNPCCKFLSFFSKFAYKAEPYIASEYKTVHEELTKSMTTILKPSADFLTSNKLLKVTWTASCALLL